MRQIRIRSRPGLKPYPLVKIARKAARVIGLKDEDFCRARFVMIPAPSRGKATFECSFDGPLTGSSIPPPVSPIPRRRGNPGPVRTLDAYSMEAVPELTKGLSCVGSKACMPLHLLSQINNPRLIYHPTAVLPHAALVHEPAYPGAPHLASPFFTSDEFRVTPPTPKPGDGPRKWAETVQNGLDVFLQMQFDCSVGFTVQ